MRVRRDAYECSTVFGRSFEHHSLAGERKHLKIKIKVMLSVQSTVRGGAMPST